MILIGALELAEFAKKNNWVLTQKSDEDDLEIGDDYICYLTPQGNRVLVRFWADGSIKEIIP